MSSNLRFRLELGSGLGLRLGLELRLELELGYPGYPDFHSTWTGLFEVFSTVRAESSYGQHLKKEIKASTRIFHGIIFVLHRLPKVI